MHPKCTKILPLFTVEKSPAANPTMILKDFINPLLVVDFSPTPQ